MINSAPSPAPTGRTLSALPASAGKGRKGAYRSRFIATRFATRTEYQEYRYELLRRLDAMAVDEVIRIPKDIAPSYSWVMIRAKLNNYVVTIRNVDDHQCWIRLK